MHINLTVVFITLAILQVSANSYAQKITLDKKNASLTEIFKEIRNQSGYDFFYDEKLVQNTKLVDIHVKNASIEKVLDQCFEGQSLAYSINSQIVVIKRKENIGISRGSSQLTIVIDISGKVTDEKGEPLPGATIRVKGANTGTTTALDGTFSIRVSDGNDVLEISYTGFVSQAIALDGKNQLNIVLQEDLAKLDEVVIIGYGTAKKSDLTGSVVRVNAETFQNQSMSQLTDMLSGTVAGFASNQGTSAAGGGSMELRGPNSLSAGSAPMLVLDGVIYNGSIRDINPNDVETIDILKDASSAAVYGSRAASGVILITTKKGKSGKPTINFTTKVGMSEAAKERRGLNGEEYVKFRQDFFRTVFPTIPYNFYTNPDKLPSDVSIDQWRNLSANPQEDNTLEWLARLRFYPTEQENYLANKTTDWYDEVMTKGSSQDYDLSIGGGTENLTYYWSIGYLDNKGIILGDKYSTVRSRMNADYKVVNWLNVGINAQFSDRDESSVPANLSFYGNSPYGQMFDNEGNLMRLPHGHTDNPLLNYYRQDRLRKINGLFANMYADVKLPFGINYRVSFQPRYETMKDLLFTSTDKRLGGLPSDISQGSREEYSHYEWMVDNLLKWNKEIGPHKIDATFLYNIEESNHWASVQKNKNFSPSEQLSYHGLQFGDGPSVSNDDYRSTGDALMARLNYTYDDRYLLTASVRRDGYSAFGTLNPRATFPALAFAWRISEEDFFKFKPISQLKLRLSWGANGNRDIGIYSALARVNSNLWYDGSTPRVGVFNSSLSNTSLRWEKTESFNVGLDVGILNNRIDVSVDYYDMTTKALLMDRSLPSPTGFDNITSNLGELGNRGLEMTVNTVNVSKQNITWKTGFTFSFNRNKIKELFGDMGEYTLLGETQYGDIPDFTNKWFPGQALDVVWDYELSGIWQVDEAAEAAKYGMRVGDFKAVDVDNDGVYNELVDKQFIGYTNPRYRLGLSNDFTLYKNLTASVFIRADLGHMDQYPNALLVGWESNDRASRNVGPVPYWTPENPINDYARLDVSTSGYGGGLRIFKPRSFVRIQDITLSYTMPSIVSNRMRLNNLRVFGAVRNLGTFTKWPNWDPESGNTPMPRSYTLGLSLSL